MYIQEIMYETYHSRGAAELELMGSKKDSLAVIDGFRTKNIRICMIL